MATPPKKTTTTTKAPAKSAAKEPTASQPAAKTTSKTPTKAKAAAKTPPSTAKSKTGATSKAAPATKAKDKTETPAAPQTPAGQPPKTTEKAAEKPAVKKDTMTAEERERSRKLKATLALLKEDPEWPAFLREQRDALLALRDELAPNVHSVTRDHLRSGDSNLSSSSGQHIGDAGSDAEVRALTIRLLDKDREQLFEIDAALERIRRGTYGICEISLDPIPKGRLRVRPFCRLTVKCQEEYEKKYGSYANYRAKNQDSVGFAGLQNDEDNAISLDDSEE